VHVVLLFYSTCTQENLDQEWEITRS
jgi:hypothetical protein